MPLFDIELYNDDFFKWHETYTKEYAFETMLKYCVEYDPKSVIDFGCGNGYYLETAFKLGKRICGLEITKDKALPYINPMIEKYILQKDVTIKVIPILYYDCVISLETAEHIEPSGTEQYIKNLINACSDNGVILFTGAPEGQGGCGHINCKPKAEWLVLFEQHGAKYQPELTEKIKELWAKAPDYIRSNLLVFKCS